MHTVPTCSSSRDSPQAVIQTISSGPSATGAAAKAEDEGAERTVEEAGREGGTFGWEKGDRGGREDYCWSLARKNAGRE